MRVDALSHLTRCQTTNTLNELANFVAANRVSVSEQDVLQVACSCNLKHNRERVGQTRLLYHNAVVGLCLAHLLDKEGNLLNLKSTESAWSERVDLDDVTLACAHIV